VIPNYRADRSTRAHRVLVKGRIEPCRSYPNSGE